MTIPLAPGGLTIEDLANLPDDGHRYELIDGSLLVSPPPDVSHVDTTERLADLLKAATPGHLRTWSAGADVQLGTNTTYFVPDIVVLRADGVRPGFALRAADVLLVVEVLSPSSRLTDQVLKRHEYAVAGIPDYWIVDREKRVLTVLALEPGSTEYAVKAEVPAGTVHVVTHPFSVELDPGTVC